MRKAFISVLILFWGSNALSAAAAPQYFSFKSEYRRDAVDYEDSEKKLFQTTGTGVPEPAKLCRSLRRVHS